MQLQEARHADEATADRPATSPMAPWPASPAIDAATLDAAGPGDGATAWLMPGATPAPTGAAEASGPGVSPDAPLAILVARSFDAFATGPAIRVQLVPDSDASVVPAASGAAVTGAPAAERDVAWLVGGLKLLALTVGLAGAYVAGLFLLGAPSSEAGPAQPPAAHAAPAR